MSDQTQLTALKRAYYAGTREVSYDGKRIVYQSMEELWRAIRRLEDELDRPLRGPRPRFGLATFNRGDA